MRFLTTTLTLAIAAALAPAQASDAPVAAAANPGAPTDLAAMQAVIARMNQQLQAQQHEIDQLRGQLDHLQLAAQQGRGVAAAPPDPAAAIPAEVAPPATALVDNPSPPLQVGEAQRADDEQRRQQDKALVVNEHAPLFERRFTFDAGLSYSYYDRRQLALSGFLALDAIFLGVINLDRTQASVATLNLTGRYGLTPRLSLEATLPYVWRDSRFVSGGAGGASSTVSEVEMRSSGFGDAALAGYYQVVKESASAPDIVAGVRLRVPTGRDPFGLKLIQPDQNNDNLNIPQSLSTGTGLYSVTGNVSALRTYDPVILFGNLGYTVNFARDFGDISPVVGQVAPAEVALGNSWELSGGLAIALNDRSAVSFSVAGSFAAATHTTAPGQPEMRVQGSSSQSTAFNVGGTYALPSGWTLNGQLAIGLTPDAPNYVFAMRGSYPF